MGTVVVQMVLHPHLENGQDLCIVVRMDLL